MLPSSVPKKVRGAAQAHELLTYTLAFADAQRRSKGARDFYASLRLRAALNSSKEIIDTAADFAGTFEIGEMAAILDSDQLGVRECPRDVF